jgi:hypothetical protein
MQHITDLTQAGLFVLQPGDATRYTCVVSDVGKAVYVAIGAGDSIVGGYELQDFQARHILERLGDEVGKDNPDFIDALRDVGHIHYWKSHTEVKNEWTAMVACLVASIMTAGYLFDEAQTDLIGGVYKQDRDIVTNALHAIFDYAASREEEL